MKPLDIIKKYYPESSDAYRILVTHSRSVADKALALARLHPEADYICHGYLGADLMRKEGYPRHALVCERHTGTGLSLAMIEERNLPVPHRDMRPVSLEEQLICFADKFFSKTKLTKEKPADKIKQSLSKYGNETVEQFEHWCKLFLGE